MILIYSCKKKAVALFAIPWLSAQIGHEMWPDPHQVKNINKLWCLMGVFNKMKDHFVFYQLRNIVFVNICDWWRPDHISWAIHAENQETAAALFGKQGAINQSMFEKSVLGWSDNL